MIDGIAVAWSFRIDTDPESVGAGEKCRPVSPPWRVKKSPKGG
jgi:hypothetical protein